jgi:SAM-dependent methyltransferase
MNEPERERQSLATGFRNVDTSGDPGACHRCLDLIADIPFFREVKRDSVRIIADAGAKRVLDGGCGAGSDLATLATCLAEPCEIIGLDASAALLTRAGERHEVRNRCSLVKGDILNNPFRDGSFDACRIDRVLQHLHEPALAIHELVRIIRPGGMLVAFDNNWDTFSISLDDREITARISRFWRDSFASGRIGKDLPRLFRECGLVEICDEPRVLAESDLSVAEQIFDLPHLLERMEQAGALLQGATTEIHRELLQRAGNGTFSSGYTGHLVWGRKPE